MPIVVHEFVEHAVPEDDLDRPQQLEQRCCLFRQSIPPDQLNPQVPDSFFVCCALTRSDVTNVWGIACLPFWLTKTTASFFCWDAMEVEEAGSFSVISCTSKSMLWACRARTLRSCRSQSQKRCTLAHEGDTYDSLLWQSLTGVWTGPPFTPGPEAGPT
jgi:hypothetical protein